MRLLLLSALVVVATSCDGTSLEDTVAGTYQAERFRVTFGDQTADFLAAGGRFDLTLDEDGRFTADLSTPDIPEIEGDESFAAVFDGTYTLRGSDRVQFFHSEDLFLRDVEWALRGGTIQTTDSAGGTEFDIALRR